MGWRALRLALEREGLLKVAGARAARGGGRAHAQRDVPDGLRAVGVRRRQGGVRKPARVPQEPEEACCPKRSAMARCSKCRRSPRCSTCWCRKIVVPVDRHQRPHPVPVRRRPRQSQARRALRLAEPGDPALPATRGGARLVGIRRRPRRVRRDGRAPARGAGAARARHPPPVDHPGRGRADQGAGPQGRSQGDLGGDARMAAVAPRRACAPRLPNGPKRAGSRPNRRRSSCRRRI